MTATKYCLWCQRETPTCAKCFGRQNEHCEECGFVYRPANYHGGPKTTLLQQIKTSIAHLRNLET